MPFHLPADQTNHRGIAGRPFTADRHGGVIPWSWFVEDFDWAPSGIPAPSVTAYLSIEYLYPLERDSLNSTGYAVTSTDLGALTVSLVLDATATAVFAEAGFPATLPAQQLRPDTASFAWYGSTDTPSGVALSLNDYAPAFRAHTPTADAVPVQSARFSLIRGVPAYSAMDTASSGGTATYLTPTGASTWTNTIDTLVSGYSGGSVWLHVPQVGGWAYATQLDPETGIVTEAVPMPHPSIANEVVRFYDDSGGLVAGADSNGIPWCQCCALSWPTGIRKLRGQFAGDTAPGAWTGSILWRAADDWQYAAEVLSSASAFDWGAAGGSLNWSPASDSTQMRLFRSMRPIQQSVLTAGSSYDPAGAGGWYLLASFSGTDFDIVDAVMGSTLPSEGDEVIIYGSTNILPAGHHGYAPLRFILAPEPGKCPVPLAVAGGGILQ